MESDNTLPEQKSRPPPYDRRGTDLLNESTRTRLAVLETSVAHQDARISDMELYQRAISTKLNNKIQEDSVNSIRMERTLAQAVSELSELSADLRDTTAVASKAARLADKHETMGITLLKLGSAITIVLGALWALARVVVGF